MKYRSKLEENSTWVLLAALWALGGLAAWITAIFTRSSAVDGSTLTALSMMVVALGLSLRLPMLTTPPRTNPTSERLVFLLAYAATVNWLGYLILRSTGLGEVLPAILCVAVAEGWMLSRVGSAGCLEWLQVHPADEQARGPAVELPASAKPLIVRVEAAGEASSEVAVAVAEPAERQNDNRQEAGIDRYEAASFVRQTIEDRDEQGRRFLSGQVRVTMAPGQATEQVVLGFCPAFEGDPSVEFETTHEQVAGRLVTCTPIGGRIALRRSQADEAVEFMVEWYASGATEEEAAGGLASQRVLP